MFKKDSDNKIDEIVKKYADVYKNEDIKFDNINMLFPGFIYDITEEGINNINQVRMSNGIFITSIVNNYFEYIQKLYNIDPLLYEEERLKYVRKQLNITVTPETIDTIEEIKKLIGTSGRGGVVKNAVEHYLATKQKAVLREDVLQDDD